MKTLALLLLSLPLAAQVTVTKSQATVTATTGTTVGTATFYRNGTVIGTAMTSAVTPSAALTPVVAVFSRTSASRNVDVDHILVQQQR